MPNFNRAKGLFKYRGVNLNCAVDAIPPDQLGIGTNVRPNQQGTLSTRPALVSYLNPNPGSPVHSLKTFSAGGITRRFSGAGTQLFMDSSNVAVDSGFSGNPLMFAAYQPEQSVQPFLYVADSQRYSKIRASDGKRFGVGLVPPAGPPTSQLIQPLYNVVHDFLTNSGPTNLWIPSGTASGDTLSPRVPSGTTIQEILYDSGSTGWACVAFSTSATAWLTQWVRIEIDSEISTVVDMIPAAAVTTTTIQAIAYDSASSGPCCIVLASSTSNLQRNSLLQLGSEYVRVTAVTIGSDNSVSFRCSTVGTHAAGETVTFYSCARMYFTATHTTSSTVAGNYVTNQITVGVGYSDHTFQNGSPPYGDFSQVNGRPLTGDDWLHISLLIDNLANISLIRILFDVDNTTNDFAHNYYYADITPNVYQAATTGSQSASSTQATAVQVGTTQAQIAQLQAQQEAAAAIGDVATAQQLAELVSELATSAQLYTGSNQWSEIHVPLSSLLFNRVGTDATVSLASVKTARVEITAVGTVNVGMTSWWIGGGYGPNAPESVNPENPIKYCYRYRSTITGAQSTWSPLTRHGLFPERQGVVITGTMSTQQQCDTVDIARVGATINGTPQYLASVTNNPAGGTWSYTDNYNDDQLGQQNEPGDNQPWPVQQPPINGTCNVVGTSVYGTSVGVPTTLCQGTVVLINGSATTIRGLPSSNAFQVEDTFPPGTAVAFQIASPTTFGNPLPYLAGPFDETIFAAGDPVNPGRLYFCKRENPDEAATSGYIDITNSTEPILGLIVWNGYVVAMTSEAFYPVTTTGNADTPYAYTTSSVGCGILQPWTYSAGPAIFFWSRNGIMMTDLGPAKSISADDLYPYLPHEGVAGSAINGYSPPPVAVLPRLAYCKNGWLYVDFVDSASAYRSLAFDTNKPGWWFDRYTPGVALHYQDEVENSLSVLCGCQDGSIQQLGNAASDSGGPIACQARIGSQNFGDLRSLKQAIDLTLEVIGSITTTLYANSWTVNVFSTDLTGAAGSPQILPIDNEYDPTKLYFDFAIDLTWLGQQQVIEYDLGYLQNPMLAADMVANPSALGFEDYGHVREVILWTVASTAFTANLVIGCEFPGTMTIPVSIAAGAQRQFITLPPNKGQLYEWALQGLGSNLGLFDCAAHVKGWRETDYRSANPFVE